MNVVHPYLTQSSGRNRVASALLSHFTDGYTEVRSAEGLAQQVPGRGLPAGLGGPPAGGAEGGAAAGGMSSPRSAAQPSGGWLFASFPKVASDKSIYLGQIVSEKLPLELPGTKPAV